MEFLIGTRCQPCSIKISISSLRACSLRLQVLDENQANTYLTDRPVVCGSNETQDYYVKMPASPWTARIKLFENSSNTGDDLKQLGITVSMPKVVHLVREYGAIDWSPSLVDAVNFCRRFCYNAGWLPVNKEGYVYKSFAGTIQMAYKDVLMDPESGSEAITPMRIGQTTGIMQASQRLIVPYTVPGRAVMFYHEYSHAHENKDPDWEAEADLNGLSIYLGLGYPVQEAIEVYKNVFNQADTDQNRERYDHIMSFLVNYTDKIPT